MNAVCILVTIAFWASLIVRMAEPIRFILFLLALLVGILFTLAGGFAYWWDQSMQPDKASAVMLVCGLLILASQIAPVFRSLAREWHE